MDKKYPWAERQGVSIWIIIIQRCPGSVKPMSYIIKKLLLGLPGDELAPILICGWTAAP